jgi:hypothetical protein
MCVRRGDFATHGRASLELAVLPVHLAGGGWGEIKAAEFFANGWNMADLLVREGENAEGGRFLTRVTGHGSWVMGGREDDFEPPRRQGTQSGGDGFTGEGDGEELAQAHAGMANGKVRGADHEG